MPPELKLENVPFNELAKDNPSDPIRYYFWPIIGRLYRKRVEMCLGECKGGERALEIGFGIGLTFDYLDQIYREIHGLDLHADIDKVSRFFEERGIKPHLKNGNVLNMPYPEDYFDTVLLISILEHLKPHEQITAMQEIWRVLKPGGQLVYGVPVERPFMVFMFRLLGVNIRELHFSTEEDVSQAASQLFRQVNLIPLKSFFPTGGSIYHIGHFEKPVITN